MRGEALWVLAVTLAVAVAAPGCLRDGNGVIEETYWDWQLGLEIVRFEHDGSDIFCNTYLLLEVRFGPLERDDWRVSESNSFQKGNESWFPMRLEARYDDGVSEVEDFPILGSSNVLTGIVLYEGGRMKVQLDGDPELITMDDSIDRYPHEHEVTITLEGDRGSLILHIGMLEP